jgi:succinate CoA transferase
MSYNMITAAEGAAMINDGDYIGFSGFTPNGNPKAVARELSKRAIREHAAGHPLSIGMITGASSCQSLEGDFADAHALKFRGPFSTNKDFRDHTNLGEVDYEDMHLGHVAERLRRGFYGHLQWAIVEISSYEDVGNKCRVTLTSAGGIVPTIVRLADHVILELNHFHSPKSGLMHDVIEMDEYPNRKPMLITHINDRIGTQYVEIDSSKIVGIVDSNIPEEARAFKAVNAETRAIGHNVAEFLLQDQKAGHIPPEFFPMQSGVGATGNAVMAAIGECTNLPKLNIFSEVSQDAVIYMIERGQIDQATCTGLTVTNECLQHVYENIDFFSKHITLRPSELANSPELIRRFGVISMNTALECDLYGNENSSHVCGSKLMNGIGGSCDYTRNGSISIFYTPSTAKGGTISAIVPMCSHVDSTEHDVDLIVTEQGVADLRGKGPLRRAEEVIEHCAHPDYKPLLREYLRIADHGHEPESMRAAFALHDTFLTKGDMRLTNFGDYLK